MLPGRQKVDISSFTDAERELFQKYGKIPSAKNLLSNKLKERKYFDSGDYAMSKAGVSPQHNVGTAIPSPSDIPHSNPSTSPSSSGGIGITSTSPTNTSTAGHATAMGTSPGKESGLGTGRENNLTFGRQ